MITNTSMQLYKTIADADKQRPMELWHASSIANCPRNLFLARKGVQRLTQPTGAKVLRWQAGHNIEAAIEPYVKEIYGYDVQHNERFVSEELQLTGEYDFYSPSKQTIIEIKSVHDMAFIEKNGQLGLKQQDGLWSGGRWDGKKKWKLKQDPYLHHEMQEYCYVLLMKEKGIEVKGVDYIYISLSGRLVTYSTEVNHDSEVAQSVRGRLNMLNEAWRTNTPPPCFCEQTESPLYDSVLKWCDYQSEDSECCSLSLIKE